MRAMSAQAVSAAVSRAIVGRRLSNRGRQIGGASHDDCCWLQRAALPPPQSEPNKSISYCGVCGTLPAIGTLTLLSWEQYDADHMLPLCSRCASVVRSFCERLKSCGLLRSLVWEQERRVALPTPEPPASRLYADETYQCPDCLWTIRRRNQHPAMECQSYRFRSREST